MGRVAAITVLCCAASHPERAAADAPDLSRACTVVGAGDASALLGYDVVAPDEASRAGGICTFPSRSASQDGVVSYAVVTADALPARRAYFAVLARRCAGVSPRAPSAALCAGYVKLASAADVARYYAGRVEMPDATPRPGLGDAAQVTATALYVLRGGEVFECVVRRGDALDVERSAALATLLLARVPPQAAAPGPTPGP